MTLDEERLRHAEMKARDGETEGAKELLWTLLSDFARRSRAEEPSIEIRRRALELLSAIAPEDVDVACSCARILLPDQVETALGVIRGALRVSPRSIASLRVLAEVHRVGGHLAKALEAYEQLLRACREQIRAGGGVLTPDEAQRLEQVDAFTRYRLFERAEDTLRALLAGRETLHPAVHRSAADLAHATNKPPDRGVEHEILACLLQLAHDREEAAKEWFARAQERYPEVEVLRDLPGRVM